MDRKHQLCALIERCYRQEHHTHRELVASRTTWQRIKQRDPQLTYTLLLRILARAGYTTQDYYILLHADHKNYPNWPRQAVYDTIITGLQKHTIHIYNEEPEVKSTRRTKYILVGVFGALFCLLTAIVVYGAITL